MSANEMHMSWLLKGAIDARNLITQREGAPIGMDKPKKPTCNIIIEQVHETTMAHAGKGNPTAKHI